MYENLTKEQWEEMTEDITAQAILIVEGTEQSGDETMMYLSDMIDDVSVALQEGEDPRAMAGYEDADPEVINWAINTVNHYNYKKEY